MSDVFFQDLGLRPPDVSLDVGSGTHGYQTGTVMRRLEALIATERPALMVTVGDVNSTLAAALVAAKASIPLAHVEAGLRSRDAAMPEEVNRVVTDRLSDLLFTHSEEADDNLRAEGASSDRIKFVGNVMIDTLLKMRPNWQGRGVPPDFARGGYAVVTLHRPSNVDDKPGLERIMSALDDVALRLPIIFPVHPRTEANLVGMKSDRVRLIKPLGYLAFLDLVEHARLVITDSGGIQEETTVLGVPCLTLRESTERPVTVRLGTNRVIGADPATISQAVDAVLSSPPASPMFPPLWDGHAGERIAAEVSAWLLERHAGRLAK
jgi:UDP-N-acetylglucosamine 2-epimerase (non-hydrolysing)